MTLPRKILLYLPALIGGGAERVFALLASAFAAQGIEVVFAVDRPAEENAGYLDARVRVVVLGAGHLGATLALARLLRAEKPDVSLSGLGVANLKHTIAATLAGRLRRAMLSFHAFFETENLNGRLSALGNGLTPLLTRITGHSVAVSDGLLHYMVAQKGACPARCSRIHNPVILPPVAAAPDAPALAARAPVVLYLGRFHPDKDVGTLLRAFAQVRTPGARLVLAGDGPERPAYEALAQTLGLGERAHFAGYQKDPAAMFGQARVLALSSQRESFGNVVAEALANGLAVVTSDAPGPVEIVDAGRFGAVVPRADAAAMARAIEAALADPGDPAPRVAHAQRFSVASAAQQYLARMGEVMARAL